MLPRCFADENNVGVRITFSRNSHTDRALLANRTLLNLFGDFV
jgi:hypothetical protein